MYAWWRSLTAALVVLSILRATVIQAGILLFEDDFEFGLDPVWVTPGEYKPAVWVADGWLHTEDTFALPGRDSYTFVHDSDSAWRNYQFSLVVDPIAKAESGTVHESARIYFRTRDMVPTSYAPDFTGYELFLAGPQHNPSGPEADGPYVLLNRIDKDGPNSILFSSPGLATSGPMMVEIRATGAHLSVVLDGTEIISVTDPDPFLFGGIGVGGIWEAHNRWDNVLVTGPGPVIPEAALSSLLAMGAIGLCLFRGVAGRRRCDASAYSR